LGLPKNIIQNQRKNVLELADEPISVLQKWLEEKQPDYLNCAPPSIAKQLDLSKLRFNLILKVPGEMGGSMYSSEECGTSGHQLSRIILMLSMLWKT
jgi:hypothetical protein